MRPSSTPAIALALIAGGVLAGAPGAATAGTTRPAAPATAAVVLRDIAFHSPAVTIRRGGTVSWSWRDGTESGSEAVSHNVTSSGSPRFRSIESRRRGSVSRTFAKAGTYRYLCTIHFGMTGRIVVR